MAAEDKETATQDSSSRAPSDSATDDFAPGRPPADQETLTSRGGPTNRTMNTVILSPDPSQNGFLWKRKDGDPPETAGKVPSLFGREAGYMHVSVPTGTEVVMGRNGSSVTVDHRVSAGGWLHDQSTTESSAPSSASPETSKDAGGGK